MLLNIGDATIVSLQRRFQLISLSINFSCRSANIRAACFSDQYAAVAPRHVAARFPCIFHTLSSIYGHTHTVGICSASKCKQLPMPWQNKNRYIWTITTVC